MPKSSVSSKHRSPLRFAAESASAVAKTLLLTVLAAYRLFVSPLLGPSCRFAPSCSAYASEAVRRHGAWWGGWLAARRIAHCHPWNAGGYDPVPDRSR